MKEIRHVGIIGDGQLGMLLTEAAHEMDIRTTVLGMSENSPAVLAGAGYIPAESFFDEVAIRQLAESTDVVTLDLEHTAAPFLVSLQEEGFNIQPDPKTLVMIQDKLLQKKYLKSKGLPVGPFVDLSDTGSLSGIWDSGQFVVKKRKGGYDGRGNLVVNRLDDPEIFEEFGDSPLYAETKLDFARELSVIAARDMSGRITTYPVVETVHVNNQCHSVYSPARIPEQRAEEANEIAHETLKHLGGAGIFAIEMFDLEEGDILINEIAPRVHNSGHLTIEAHETSQFVQHLLAITGQQLGPTTQYPKFKAAVMYNVLGRHNAPYTDAGLEFASIVPDTYVHLYFKAAKLGRKIGHITALGSNLDNCYNKAEYARSLLEN